MSEQITACQLKPGQVAIITGYKSDLKSKSRLVEMGFLPGTKIRFIKQAIFKGAIEFKIRNYYVSLRLEDSHNIIIEEIY